MKAYLNLEILQRVRSYLHNETHSVSPLAGSFKVFNHNYDNQADYHSRRGTGTVCLDFFNLEIRGKSHALSLNNRVKFG